MGAGSQYESTKASAAVVHFPGAQRDAAEKIFISLEHEKSGFGKESPGEQQRGQQCGHYVKAKEKHQSRLSRSSIQSQMRMQPTILCFLLTAICTQCGQQPFQKGVLPSDT